MINPQLDSYIGYLDAYLSHLKLIRWNQFVAGHQQGNVPRFQSTPQFFGAGLSVQRPLNPFVANPLTQVNLWNQPPQRFPSVNHWNRSDPEPVVIKQQFPRVDNWNSPAASDEEGPSRSPSPLRLPPEGLKMDDNPELIALKKILKSLAIPFPDGIALGRLNGEYKDLEGRDIPYHEFGHSTLTQFLRDICKDVLYFGCDKMGTSVVKAYYDADTAHVQSLVKGQRKVSRKRKPVLSRPLFNSHRRAYGQFNIGVRSGLAQSSRTVGGSRLNPIWSSNPTLNPSLKPYVPLSQSGATFNRPSPSTITRPSPSMITRPSPSMITRPVLGSSQMMRSGVPSQAKPLSAEEKERLRNKQHQIAAVNKACLPNEVRQQVFSFMKYHYPEPVPILGFVELWETKYENTANPGWIQKFEFKNFGFLTIYQALKSIPEVVEVTQPARGPAVAALSQSALTRLDDDGITPIVESSLPDLKNLKIEPSTSMPPPLSPAKSPKAPITSVGRGIRIRADDDMPLGSEASSFRLPPPLRRLGSSAVKPKPETDSTPDVPTFDTEEELYEYLKKKTGIDDMDILEAMVTPEKSAFMKRREEKKKENRKIFEETGGIKLPKETQQVFEKILSTDADLRGIPVTFFIQEYKRIVGLDINPVSLGFSSIMEIFRSSSTLFHVSEKQEAVEIHKYPGAGDEDYHVYDASRYFANHPETAPQHLLFRFYPDLTEVMNKLVATFLSLDGSMNQYSMQVIESEYKKLFKQKLDPSEFHFGTMFSLVKRLGEEIAQVVEVIENNRQKQNHVVFLKEGGFKNWFDRKWDEPEGLDTIRKVLQWSKRCPVDECAILPPTNDYRDCLIQERKLTEADLTSPNDQITDFSNCVWHSVIISAASSPRAFWVNLGKDRKKINDMADELERFYHPDVLSSNGHDTFPYSQSNGSNPSYEIPDFLIRPGMVCVVKFKSDQSYQRGIIMNCDNAAAISVRFLDFGGSANFTLKDVKFLNKHFVDNYPEAFGIKVALFGICPPVDQDRKAFPLDGRRMLLDYSDHERKIAGLFMKRKYVNPPKSGLLGLRVGRVQYECFLCDVSDDGTDKYIHEQLIQESLACRLPFKYSMAILKGEHTEEEVYNKLRTKYQRH